MPIDNTPVSPDRWRQIADVVEAALGLEPHYRYSYLRALDHQDSDLRREVEHLLDHYDTAVTRVESTPSPPRDEDRIGPYQVVEWLGKGGMGSVFLAERVDQEFDRRVAIKVLRNGAEVPMVLRRFRAERQILASFEHPNIARMYDAGTTADGRPYLVMEHVDGIPIDRYCQQSHLDIRRRLELFRKVCGAVSYAHRKLVVHRDLKPSNVLVDATGEPKLLDFGIAKILDPMDFPIVLDETVAGHAPLTPNYASPEQLRGEGVTTVSDVYSLGVLLYQLLTDELPLRLDRVLAAAAGGELESLLGEHRPTRPSLRVVATDPEEDSGPQIASSISANERQQRAGILAGDLDNITMQALRPRPEERYASADALNDDLERYLTGQAVEATGDAWLYRLGKLLRRHRLSFTLLVLAFLLTSGFALFMTHQARMLRIEKDRVTSEKNRAQSVEALFLDFLEMTEAQGEDLRASDLLNLIRTRLTSELAAYPETQDELMMALGSAYANLGRHEVAQAILIDTLEKTRQRHGESHLTVARAHVALSQAYSRAANGTALMRECKAALETFEELGAPNHRGAADCWLELTFAYLYGGQVEEMFEAIERAEEIAQALPDDEALSLEVAQARTLAYSRQGRMQAALDLYEQTVARTHEVFGEASLSHALMLHNYGALLYLSGDDERTKEVMQRSLAISTQSLPDGHTTVGSARKYLAMALSQLGELEEAETLLLDLLANTEALLQEEQRDFRARYRQCVALAQMGILEQRRGQGDAALEYFDRLRQELPPAPYRPTTMSMLTLQTIALLGLGEVERARPNIETLAEAEHLDRDLWQMVSASGLDITPPATLPATALATGPAERGPADRGPADRGPADRGQ